MAYFEKCVGNRNNVANTTHIHIFRILLMCTCSCNYIEIFNVLVAVD